MADYAFAPTVSCGIAPQGGTGSVVLPEDTHPEGSSAEAIMTARDTDEVDHSGKSVTTNGRLQEPHLNCRRFRPAAKSNKLAFTPGEWTM